MHVPFHPHDESLEFKSTAQSGDVHGYIGSFGGRAPADSRRPIGFRLPARLVNGFPRGPAISIDGKTWQACDLRDAPP